MPIDLAEILKRPECDSLDFKERDYDLGDKRGQYALLKDLLSLANTPRENSAYLVLGVRFRPESGAQVVGLANHRDDAALHDVVRADLVQPVPRFLYHSLEYEGQRVGVIEIPVDRSGPFTPLKDLGEGPALRAGTIYVRDGSTNREAVGDAHQKIVRWFQGDATTPIGGKHEGAWGRFLEAADRLDPQRRYILITDSLREVDARTLASIGLAPWLAVVDFDPDSEVQGLLAAARANLEERRTLHRVVIGDRPTIQPQGTHWFFARGLSGRDSTLELGAFKDWLKKYKRPLEQYLRAIVAAVDPAPITVIAMWQDSALRNWLDATLHEVLAAFADLSTIVIASPVAESLESIGDKVGAQCVQVSARALCAGFADLAPDRAVGAKGGPRQVPMKEGAPWQLSVEHDLWLSEELEIVDLGAGITGASTAESFRRGMEIAWRDLQLQSDCARELTDGVRRRVERDLMQRLTSRINIYHAPGAGGTTVARRIAWDVHTRHPAVVLNRCNARETSERIAKLASLTENSVLLVVDGGQHAERSIDELYDILRSQHVPCVILQVLRRFRRPGASGINWLSAELTDFEVDRFYHAYLAIRPDRRAELDGLCRRDGAIPRTAFFFGLVAFGRDFHGLQRYVEQRLAPLTPLQRKIVGFLALAYHYGQQALPAQVFASLLGVPRSRRLDLLAALEVERDAASLSKEIVMDIGESEWRPVHSVIAEAMVVQLVGGGLPPQLWRQNLSQWAIEFAEVLRGTEGEASNRMTDLAYRVFIFRDNVELLGTERAAQREFSQLLEDVPSVAGRIEVLRRLAELFESEAHMHAHLGRFLGQEGRYAESLAAIDRAIDLMPDDSVLHHMRGMACRYQAQELIAANEPLASVIAAASDAASAFAKSRALRADNEHAYISEVQLIVRVLDYAGRDAVRIAQNSDTFVRDGIGRAEDLLDQVRSLRVGEQLSRYEEDCRARLDVLYGDHAKALQAFDNLLNRPGVEKPGIRRQVVWTMLRRRHGVWGEMTTHEVERSSRLLEENLTEDSADASSLRLWLRAIRQLEKPPHLDRALERVAYWRARGGGLDAAFYLYVLHTLLALQGSKQALADADRAQRECSAMASYRRDRTRSFEWLGLGDGITQLVHQSELGAWSNGFWEERAKLRRVSGRVATIEAPQRGTIELPGGVTAFFVPAVADCARGRDESRRVSCYVGFSYEGVRAWEVVAEED